MNYPIPISNPINVNQPHITLLKRNQDLSRLVTELKYHCDVYKLGLRSIQKIAKLQTNLLSESSNKRLVSGGGSSCRQKYHNSSVLTSQLNALQKINRILLKTRVFIHGYSLLELSSSPGKQSEAIDVGVKDNVTGIDGSVIPKDETKGNSSQTALTSLTPYKNFEHAPTTTTSNFELGIVVGNKEQKYYCNKDHKSNSRNSLDTRFELKNSHWRNRNKDKTECKSRMTADLIDLPKRDFQSVSQNAKPLTSTKTAEQRKCRRKYEARTEGGNRTHKATKQFSLDETFGRRRIGSHGTSYNNDSQITSSVSTDAEISDICSAGKCSRNRNPERNYVLHNKERQSCSVPDYSFKRPRPHINNIFRDTRNYEGWANTETNRRMNKVDSRKEISKTTESTSTRNNNKDNTQYPANNWNSCTTGRRRGNGGYDHIHQGKHFVSHSSKAQIPDSRNCGFRHQRQVRRVNVYPENGRDTDISDCKKGRNKVLQEEDGKKESHLIPSLIFPLYSCHRIQNQFHQDISMLESKSQLKSKEKVGELDSRHLKTDKNEVEDGRASSNTTLFIPNFDIKDNPIVHG